ncbi:MAG: hypothetical protein QM630_09345 [Microbacterium sp.]
MTFGTFLITFGVAGISLILGVIVRTFWISSRVNGAGFWLLALLFMGSIGAVITAYSPVVEPLWLHYVLIVVAPFVVGFIGLSVLIGRRPAADEE